MDRQRIEICDDFLIKWAITHKSLRISEKNILSHPSVNKMTAILQRRFDSCSMIRVIANEILHIVRQSASIDWLLFLSESSHRDHFLHQLRVTLIADWLLHCFFRNEVADGKYEMIRTILWSAAILHDHGYALSRLVSLIPTLFSKEKGLAGPNEQRVFFLLRKCYEDLYSPSITDRLCVPPNDNKNITELEEALYTEIRTAVTDYLGYRRAGLDDSVREKLCLDTFDHGLWSALNIAARFDDVGLPWHHRKTEMHAVTKLIEAIAIHNHSGFEGSDFDVNRNPISVILAIADEIQQWSRPILSRTKNVRLRCRVVGSRRSRSKLELHFEYDKAGLDQAGLAIDEIRRQKTASFQRLKGAAGLLSFTVNVATTD